MAFILFLISFLLFVTIIVTFHELGHFIIAKSSKMHVSEFSIGFGPRLFGFKGKETMFNIRLIPFGGYVAVVSQDTIDEIRRIQREITNEQEWAAYEEAYRRVGISIREEITKGKKPYEEHKHITKMVFAVMGIIMNFIMCYFFLSIMYFSKGRVEQSTISIVNDQGKVGVYTKQFEFIQDATAFSSTNSNCQDYGLTNCWMASPEYEGVSITKVEDIEAAFEFTSSGTSCYGNCFPFDIESMDNDAFYSQATTNSEKTDVIFNILPRHSWLFGLQKIDVAMNQTGTGYVISPTSPVMMSAQIDQTFMDSQPGEFYLFYFLSPNVNANSSSGTEHMNVVDGTVKTSDLNIAIGQKTEQNLFGFNLISSYLPTYVKSDFLTTSKNIIVDGLYYGVDLFVEVYEGLKYSFTGENNDLHMVDVDNNQGLYQSSPWYALGFNFAYFSASLGVLNVIPIPPLDGYKYWESAFEASTGKSINKKRASKIYKIGWIIVTIGSVVVFLIPGVFTTLTVAPWI